MRRLYDLAATWGLWVALVLFGIVLAVVAHAAVNEAYPAPEPGYVTVTEDRDCYVYEDQTWGCFAPGDPGEPTNREPVWTGPFEESSMAYEVWTQGGDLR